MMVHQMLGREAVLDLGHVSLQESQLEQTVAMVYSTLAPMCLVLWGMAAAILKVHVGKPLL